MLKVTGVTSVLRLENCESRLVHIFASTLTSLSQEGNIAHAGWKSAR